MAVYKLHFLRLSICLISLFLCQFSFGQTEIKGRIIDAKTKQVLPYANIQFKGKLLSDKQTDAKGAFDLCVPESADSVRFSYLGYSSETLAIRKNPIQEMLIQLTQKRIPLIY
jgi:hypothetical protein